MNASEMIVELERLKKKHGDQPIKLTGFYGDVDAAIVAAYDKEGRGPGDDGYTRVAKFFIHGAG